MKFVLCLVFLSSGLAQTQSGSATAPGDVAVVNTANPDTAGAGNQESTVVARTEADDQNPNQAATAAQAGPDADQQSGGKAARPPANAKGQSRDRSLLKPKPGQEAIKPRDYNGATGYFHPFVRMPRYVGYDLKAIGTSPFHTSKRDAKWWLIFGGATGGLIAADKYISKNAPNQPWLQTLGTDASYLGSVYTLLPLSAGFYFAGTAFHSDHFRETGLLSFETLASATIVLEGLKVVFARQRPLEGKGDGEFNAASSRLDSSFPSGHSLETMALASVVVHEYPHKTWVKVLAYSYAAGVIGARMAANKHFPGDTMAGAAMGWFIGDYVYGHRHNPQLDKKPTITQRIIDHVSIGLSYQPGY